MRLCFRCAASKYCYLMVNNIDNCEEWRKQSLSCHGRIYMLECSCRFILDTLCRVAGEALRLQCAAKQFQNLCSQRAKLLTILLQARTNRMSCVIRANEGIICLENKFHAHVQSKWLLVLQFSFAWIEQGLTFNGASTGDQVSTQDFAWLLTPQRPNKWPIATFA